jgi:hypothetical protein
MTSILTNFFDIIKVCLLAPITWPVEPPREPKAPEMIATLLKEVTNIRNIRIETFISGGYAGGGCDTYQKEIKDAVEAWLIKNTELKTEDIISFPVITRSDDDYRCYFRATAVTKIKVEKQPLVETTPKNPCPEGWHDLGYRCCLVEQDNSMSCS